MDIMLGLDDFLWQIGPPNKNGVIDFSRGNNGTIVFSDEGTTDYCLGSLRFVYFWAGRYLVFDIDRLAIWKNYSWETADLGGNTIEIPLDPTGMLIQKIEPWRYRISCLARKKSLIVSIF
jgi:hypothetical protein